MKTKYQDFHKKISLPQIQSLKLIRTYTVYFPVTLLGVIRNIVLSPHRRRDPCKEVHNQIQEKGRDEDELQEA